jgi:hypothetical protein
MHDTFPSPKELKGALQGTLLYLSLYLFVFIQFQSISKFYLFSQKTKEAKAKDRNERVSFYAIKYYNARDRLALTGDRTVGNAVEFAIAFLPLMWLHAIFVNPSQSFTICAIYTATRSYYPIVFQMKAPALLLSTIPGYAISAYLVHQLTSKVALA